MTDNVVDLKTKRLERQAEDAEPVKGENLPEFDFEAQERVNKAKAEKMAKERNQANKSVLRSYRIKT